MGRSDGPEAVQREALIAALIDLDHHIGQDGWDQPPRLFALVLTEVLAASELRHLGLQPSAEGALTAVEQESFSAGEDVLVDLARIAWPESVFGCAISLVRTFLPAAVRSRPAGRSAAAAAAVAAHPQRQEIRVVVGVGPVRTPARRGSAGLPSRGTSRPPTTSSPGWLRRWRIRWRRHMTILANRVKRPPKNSSRSRR